MGLLRSTVVRGITLPTPSNGFEQANPFFVAITVTISEGTISPSLDLSCILVRTVFIPNEDPVSTAIFTS